MEQAQTDERVRKRKKEKKHALLLRHSGEEREKRREKRERRSERRKESSIDKEGRCRNHRKEEKTSSCCGNEEALSSAFASIVIDGLSEHRQRCEKEVDARALKKRRRRERETVLSLCFLSLFLCVVRQSIEKDFFSPLPLPVSPLVTRPPPEAARHGARSAEPRAKE